MSGENLKAMVKNWVAEGWNKGNLTLVDQMYAPNFTIHDPTAPNLTGADAFKQFVTAFRVALPDIQFTVEDMAAEGDKVVWRFTAVALTGAT
jgi:predicted SnoaL-like aldol condensation-catalyzing enzyme